MKYAILAIFAAWTLLYAPASLAEEPDMGFDIAPEENLAYGWDLRPTLDFNDLQPIDCEAVRPGPTQKNELAVCMLVVLYGCYEDEDSHFIGPQVYCPLKAPGIDTYALVGFSLSIRSYSSLNAAFTPTLQAPNKMACGEFESRLLAGVPETEVSRECVTNGQRQVFRLRWRFVASVPA